MSRSLARRTTQVLLLIAFAALIVSGLEFGSAWIPSSLFSRLDPLVGVVAAIASRAIVTFWVASLLTIVLTLALGRAWCGWICPLGTALDLVPYSGRYGKRVPRSWRLGKYVTLAVILIAALLGSLGPMILDPITIIMRPLEELVRPFVGSDAVGQGIGASLSRQFVPLVAFLSLVPLLLVLGANLIQSRFWCRNLCPLGGLLALVSRVPGIRRKVAAEACTSCARCAKACPTGAIDRAAGFASDPSDCIACLSCADACKTGAISFGPKVQRERSAELGPTRRDALVAMGATGLGLTAAMLPMARPAGEILRPPSTSEERLAKLCVRCGACYGSCPTGALRPSVSFLTKAGPWTPMLDKRPAHCTPNCNLCAEACPTDAIHTFTFFESMELGLLVKAEVDRNRCRAWAEDRPCMQCQARCPIVGAIVGQDRPANLPGRGGPSIRVPVVNRELCIGCNLCADACVERVPAIGSPLPEIPAGMDMRRGMPGMHGVPGMPPQP